MMELKDRIKQVRKTCKAGTQREFASILGVSEARVKSLETGRVKDISALEANDMVNYFNLCLNWLLTGEGEMYKNSQPKNNIMEINKNDEVAKIPEYDISLSAGHGSYINQDDEDIISYHSFSLKFLREKALAPSSLMLVKVRGDSMEPLLKHCDLIMIDTSQNKANEYTPFAIRLEGDLLVKLLQKDGEGNLSLVSVNKSYNDIVIKKDNPPVDFEILGAIVWHSHSWV